MNHAKLIRPPKLQRGDKVATVSLSNGIAGDEGFIERYKIGVQRLKEVFGLEVVAMPHSLKGSDYLYKNPQARAQDLMDAFKDPSIKAILSNIGGEESIRLLPYVDFDVIKNNPKIVMGYSDTTSVHLMCFKAGLSSFYGPSVLSEFSENVRMHEYTCRWLQKTLFCSEPVGDMPPSPFWTSEFLDWAEPKNAQIERKVHPNCGYELLRGAGVVRGPLFGGCIEVLEMAKGTELWPDKKHLDGSILFFETSEETPPPEYLGYWLRNYGVQGILQRASGMVFGKPYGNKHYEDYKRVILKIADEFGLINLPILCNLNFGHTAPMTVLPYGALAEIDCDKVSFSLLEPGVD